MNELVLAVKRSSLNIGVNGLYPMDLRNVAPHDYAFLPRHLADNKSEDAIRLGDMYPQILGYIQIVNKDGLILAYQRKGKEEGLLGKWSIGVGGHVSQEDLMHYSDTETTYEMPSLATLVYLGTIRELSEELGVDLGWSDFDMPDVVLDKLDRIVSTKADVTSSVHVGVTARVVIDVELTPLRLNPSEFNNWKWVTEDYLKDQVENFETWSQILIQDM